MRPSQRAARGFSAALLLAGGLVVLTGGPAGSYVLPTSSAGTTLTYASGLSVVGAATGAGDKTVTLDDIGDGAFGYRADDYVPAVDAGTDALELLVPAQPVTASCPNLGLCPGLGSFTFTFSQPVTNPRLHLAELGDTTSATGARNTTHSRLTVATAGVTPSVASGRNLSISGSTIQLTSPTSSADCDNNSTPPGCGTILLTGTFSTLTLTVDSFTAATSETFTGHAADAFGVTFSLDEDFGDAPSSFDAGGAARTIRGDLALGAGVSADNTTTQAATTSPNAGASAGGDTDDAFPGATLSPLSGAAATYALAVPISGASKAGTVCGWVDFDLDGVFDNPGERTCTPFAAGATSVALSWTVPAHLPGTTYVRLRAGYTVATTQAPTGASDSGEVEDYVLSMVGDPLTCANTVYAVRSGSPHDVYSVDLGTGTLTGVAQLATTVNTNALAISADGRYVYASSGASVVRYDSQTGVTDTYAGVTGALATHGALNPATGIYYYGGVNSSTDVVSVYGFDIATSTSLGLVAQGTLPDATGGNGDWAFDGQGNLFLIAGAGSSNPLIALGQQLPTTVQGTPLAVSGTLITNVNSSGDAINGMAFAGGSLYLASSSTLFQAHPTTGVVVDTEALSPSGVSVDLASCSTPSAMQVRKDVVSRFASTDQFTVSVTGGGITTGNTATTTGTDTGPQTDADEVAGPVLGQAGTTYTITETAAGTTNLLSYSTTWACVDAANGNTAVASGSGTTGTFTMPSTGSSAASVVCTFTNTAAQPSISLDKQAGTPTGNTAGSTITYTFLVTNTGTAPLDLVTVTDPLVGTVTCPGGALAAGASRTCTAPPYAITQADIDNGSVQNTATASGTSQGGTVVTAQDSTTTPITQVRELVLDKSAAAPVDVNNSGVTDVGDTIAYSFTVLNNGNVTMTDITVTDPKVEPVECAPLTLAPGQSAACTAPVYVVTEADQSAGSVDNTARAAGVAPGNVPVLSNTDSTSTPVTTPAPGLAIDKVAGTPADVNNSGITDAGDMIAYTFTVENTGNVALSSIAVVDPMAGAVTCTPTALGAGESASCIANAFYVVTEADEAAGSVDNVAFATATDPDDHGVTSNQDTTSTPVTTPAPSLTMDKTAGAPVDVNGSGLTDAGDTIAYTFKVTNTGNVPVRNLVIDDPAVGAVTCVSTSVQPGGIATCTTDTPYVVTEADEQNGSVDNVAHAEGDDPDGDPVESNTDSTSTPTTVPVTELVFEKAARAPVDVNRSGMTDGGDTIHYEFKVWNLGNVPVTGVTVSDAMVGSVTCDDTVLPPLESTDCVADAVYVVTEQDEATGSVDNTATSVAVDPDGDPVTSPPDSTSTPVTAPVPSLVLDKQSGQATDTNHNSAIDAGDTIGYTFVLTNDGNVPLAGLVVTDPKAGAVSCPQDSIPVGQSVTCTASYTLTQADVNAGFVLNVAGAAAFGPDQDLVASNQDSTTTPMVAEPELAIEKTGVLTDGDGDARADVGEEVVYRFTVTNSGNITIGDVAVDDPKAGSVTCVATLLEPGESTRCAADAPYVVKRSDVNAGDVVNVATATGLSPDQTFVESPPDTARTAADAARSLGLVKSNALVDGDGDGRADVREVIQYSFLVSNTGSVTVTGIKIDDPMLSNIVCPLRVLLPGLEMTCTGTYVVTQADVERGGTLVNVATAIGDTVSSRAAGTRTPVDVSDTQSGTNGGNGGNGGSGGAGALPETGGPSRRLPWFGGGLLLLGALMVGWSRREPLSRCPRVSPWRISSSTPGVSGSRRTR